MFKRQFAIQQGVTASDDYKPSYFFQRMDGKNEISESGTATGQAKSVRSSPAKSIANSPAKMTTNSPSPSRQVPLSDYSPLKGPKSIASFFTPPQPVKPSSLSASPAKATSFSSPIATKPAISSSLKPHAQVPVDDSGSDLTLSEGESQEEIIEKTEEENVRDKYEDEEISFKPKTARGIPFNLNEDEDEEVEAEDEKEISDYQQSEQENNSESDISVIISLPSTDSNDDVVVSRRYADISNSEYESVSEDEVDDIPVIMDSDEVDNDQIPVMVFNSNQITIQSSPEKKPSSPERHPVVPPSEMPEKNIPAKRTYEIPTKSGGDFSAVNVSINREIENRTQQNGKSSTDEQIRYAVKSSLVGIDHQQPSPKKRAIDAVQSTEDLSPVRNIPKPPTSAHPTIQPEQSAIPLKVPITRIVNNSPSSSMNYSETVAQNNARLAVINNGAMNGISRAKTGYVYDERMLHHFDPHDPEHPEKPARISSIYEKLRSAKLLERSQRIPIQVKLAEFAPEVQSVHDTKYCRMINQTSLIRNLEELHQISSQFNSVYINPSTAISATVAAAATIELCQSIGRGDIENGFAIVRPPGHHAEHDEPMGFCIYNNVAVAASSLLRKNLARKILILDWDVHHGNGTQNAFADSGDVLYISLHRYDGGKFYPHIEEANCTYVGTGTAGLGKSVNVAWNGPGYGDADYLYAFSRLIMPIAREFNPDFVIVSAGFDAAAGDPIGECELTTYGYSMMLQELMSLAGGKLALVLEGGYNLEVISKCYEACVRILLKEAPPIAPGPMIASPKAIFAVESSVISQSPYWKCLFPKPGNFPIENVPQVPLAKILDQYWREECKINFNLSPIPGLFKTCSESFTQKYTNRVLASEGALFCPDVLIIFAHESGPILSNSFISSLCLQPSKINQSQPFLTLLKAVNEQSLNYSFIDINLPSRVWKLKQGQLGNEVESQELNVLFTLLWDRLISRSGCKNVFFVAAGSPIYAIGNLINTREIEAQVRGCFFFSSTLFIPIINSARAPWYQRNSHVVVPSQDPIKKAINSTLPGFGSCFSAGQWLMSDSAAAVGDFKVEILNFIRTRLQRP